MKLKFWLLNQYYEISEWSGKESTWGVWYYKSLK